MTRLGNALFLVAAAALMMSAATASPLGVGVKTRAVKGHPYG